ncbi:MAG TPA: long-chain fatty acid--CoA ligase [Puia sp.]|nr:long-chain fatty acid--CoA ligase [Puia sp.]
MKGQMMDYALTTHSILEYGNRVFPQKEIVSKLPDGSWHRYRYHDLYRRTKQLAHALVHTLHVKPGEKIATFAWNHYQHLELYYAIPGASAICHTLNIRLSHDQVQYIINHAEDKIIFADASLVAFLEKISPLLPTVEHYIIINAGPNFQSTLPNYRLYETLIAAGSTDYEWPDTDENDACALCYTSGTTGNPKGALYSHRSTYLHALSSIMPNAANLSCFDKSLIIVPQFHAMAWGAPFNCIMAGVEIVMPSCHLQAAPLIDIIIKEKVTRGLGIPTIWLAVYEALMKNPPGSDFTLKEFLCGGSALPKSLIEGYEKNFGIRALHAWGMTETSPMGTVSRLQSAHKDLPLEEQYKVRARQGFEIPGVEIKLVTEDGTIAPRDGVTLGEIVIRGPWVIDSYYKIEDNEAYFTSDGWFRTGDVGTLDTEGYLQISDRSKDLIKSGGEWISSVALEVALMAHPSIREACVIAVPHEKWLERPLACIVPAEGTVVREDELKTFLSREFANYQIPERFVTIGEIPKTSVGKFNKKELRRMYAAGELV